MRAVSFMDGSSPRPSRMNIVNSDLGFLGYNAAESYGVSYKARGCGATTPAICDDLDVFGNQTGSTFHDNYIGTYTWGANKMTFDKNKYLHNKYYGLDPHDDSDNLTITNNTFADNGNHGLICSQRCNNLLIKNNISRHNTSATAETHGIMLHRGVTDTVVENNIVENNTTGGGIVVFDSVGNSIKNNTVTGNKYGLRFSVGTKDLVVSNNTVKGSLQYAVYTYKGSDVPSFTGTSGRPTGITFTGNTFDGAGAELFKIQDSDKFTFTGGSIKPGALTRGPKFERAAGHVFGPVTMPSGTTTFTLRGTSAVKTTLAIKGISASAVKIDKDAYSSATFDGTTVVRDAHRYRDDHSDGDRAATTAASDRPRSAAPTATLPVVVNAPTSPILAPTGVAEAPPLSGRPLPSREPWGPHDLIRLHVWVPGTVSQPLISAPAANRPGGHRSQPGIRREVLDRILIFNPTARRLPYHNRDPRRPTMRQAWRADSRVSAGQMRCAEFLAPTISRPLRSPAAGQLSRRRGRRTDAVAQLREQTAELRALTRVNRHHRQQRRGRVVALPL